MRVRKVITRSGKRSRGKFLSIKLGRIVQCEPLERAAILLLENRPRVTSYKGQPTVEVSYDVEGDAQRHVSDFRITLADGRTLDIEVKPSRHLGLPTASGKGAVR